MWCTVPAPGAPRWDAALERDPSTAVLAPGLPHVLGDLGEAERLTQKRLAAARVADKGAHTLETLEGNIPRARRSSGR